MREYDHGIFSQEHKARRELCARCELTGLYAKDKHWDADLITLDAADIYQAGM